jgi:tol-pal system protein YbgF
MKKLFIILALLPCFAFASDNKALSELTSRVLKLEEQNRRLTGKIEELEFNLRGANKDIEELEEKITELQKKPAENISNLKPAAAAMPKPEAPKTEEKPQNSSAAKDFETAFEALSNKEINKARKGFSDFVSKYQGSELAGEAYYWLGEIALGEKDYNTAAINYLKGYKTYPKGSKAADNILRTAQMLQKLGKFEEACQNITRFEREFKTANAHLKKSAAKTKLELECE